MIVISLERMSVMSGKFLKYYLDGVCTHVFFRLDYPWEAM